MNDINHPQSPRLLPHQEEFVKQLLRPEASSIQVLSAPTGSGASFTACEAIRRTLSQLESSHILYLGHNSALVEQIGVRLHSVGIDPVTATRYRYRELMEDSESSPWERPGAYIATLQFAMQEDVAETIARAASWDLVIIDSPMRSSHKQELFLDALLEGLGKGRLLILHNTFAGSELPAALKSASVTTWKLEELVDLNGQPLWQPGQFTLEAIPFEISEEANTTIQRLNNLIQRIGSAFGKKRSHAMSVSLPGPKDLFSYEPRLRDHYSRLREHRNLIAHGREGNEGFEQDLGVLESLLQDIEQTLAAIEAQESDPKIEAVIRRLQGDQREKLRTVITTSMLATANYLYEALEEEFTQVYSLSGSMPTAERSAGLHQFHNTGGILIATEAILQGVDFRGVDTLVPYEPPSTPQRTLFLISRFMRVNRTQPLEILVPVESSESEEPLSVFRQALESLTKPLKIQEPR